MSDETHQVYEVHGQITQNQKPVIGVLVQAFDRIFRKEELLGETVTDQQGNYRIQYKAVNKLNINLVIRVGQVDSPLASSNVIYYAKPVETINLVVPASIESTEWEETGEKILALLGEVTPSDYSEEDVEYIAGMTHLSTHQIKQWMRAYHLHMELDQVQEVFFYGFMRQGFSSELQGIIKHSSEEMANALQQAIHNKVIPVQEESQIDKVVTILQQHGKKVRDAAFIKLLQVVFPEIKHDQVIQQYQESEGATDAFWTNMSGETLFSKELKFALEMNDWTHQNLPLIAEMRKMRQDEESTVKALAKLDLSEWSKLVKRSVKKGGILPVDLSGKTQEEQISAFAEQLLQKIEELDPNAFIAYQLTKAPEIKYKYRSKSKNKEALRKEISLFPELDEKQMLAKAKKTGSFHNPIRDDLVQFFDQAQDFDLQTTVIDEYIAEHGAQVLKRQDHLSKESLVGRLKAFQRVAQVAPRFDQFRVLLEEGYDSAFKITDVSENVFVNQFAQLLDEAQAKEIYANAEQLTATATHLFTTIHQVMNDVTPAAMEDSQAAEILRKEFPNWTTLFGRLDLCDCAHCRSVYSPAAYFVDLIQYLPEYFRQFLFTRRPDLQHIQLTCENTNTTLPYIDLINEVLESYIALGYPVVNNTSTDISSDALKVNREYSDSFTEEISNQVYQRLEGAVYPYLLPFHKHLHSIRAYLKQLGTSRYELMEAFPNTSLALDRMSEFLELSTKDRDIWLQKEMIPLQTFYGYSEDKPGLMGYYFDNVSLTGTPKLTRVDEKILFNWGTSSPDPTVPNDFTIRWVGNLVPQVTDMYVFYTRSGDGCKLWLDDQLIIDEGVYPNPTEKSSTLIPLEAGKSYNLKLEYYGQGIAGVMELRWAGGKVAKAIIGSDVLRHPQLAEQEIEKVPEFLKRTGLTYEELLSLLSTRFINPNPASPSVKLVYEDDPCDLEKTKIIGLFSDQYYFPPLRKIHRFIRLWRKLNLTMNELDKMLYQFGSSPEVFFVNYSEMKRLQLEIGEKKVSIEELLSLWFKLDTQGKDSLYHSLFQNKAIFNPPDVDFQLTPDGKELVGKEKSLDSKTSVLQAMLRITSEELALIRQDSNLVEESIKLTLSNVSTLYRYTLLSRLLKLSIADLIACKKLFDLNPFSSPGQTLQFSKLVHFIERSPFSVRLLEYLFLNEAKLDVMVTLSNLTTILAKSLKSGFEQISLDTESSPERQQEQKRLLVIQKLSQAFGETEPMISLLVETILQSTGATPNQKMLNDFLHPDQTAFSLSCYRLYKAVQLIQHFSLTMEELKYFNTYQSDFENFNLNQLPIDGKPTPSLVRLLFRQWLRLQEYTSMRQAIITPDQSWFTLFQEARKPGITLGQVLDILANVTGWDRKDLGVICGTDALSLQPQDFINAASLTQIEATITLLKRLKVSADQVITWLKTSPNATISTAVKEIVKARYDEETWLHIAAPIEDALREQQRKALISYTLQIPAIRNAGISNANELYEYFLIDVEMGACMKTSRIKQAISSVQLFVQRAFLNLEPEVQPMWLDRKKWEWMKNYRVWEANRKVFLYPENWLQPELRDDKTPFFTELETGLIQNEITPENADTSLFEYVEKLAEVAHLDIRAIYREQYPVDTYHVFARTYSTPYVYYHRTRRQEVWSPWQKVDVDIQGDHLIPIVYNQRLYLFWPIFEKVADPVSSTPSSTNQGNVPKENFTIKLAWSQLRKEQWTAKKVSTQKIRLTELIDGSNEEKVRLSYTFRALESGSYPNPYINIKMMKDVNPELPKGLYKIIELGEFQFYLDEKVVAKEKSSVYNRVNMQNVHIAGMKLEADAEIQPLILTKFDVYNQPNVFPLQYLGASDGRSRVVPLDQHVGFSISINYAPAFFYQDGARTYFADSKPEWKVTDHKYRFATHFHPHAGRFLSSSKAGSKELLQIYTQQLTNDPSNQTVFQNKYTPSALVQGNFPDAYPKEDVDFTDQGAYSIYNWELFFHIPLLIAERFSKEQRFVEAQRWFHCIFNPTTNVGGDTSKRFWQFLPFYNQTEEQRIWKLLTALADPQGDPNLKREMQNQIAKWREQPFQPHQIARMRYGAYKKNVVMKYLDNLIAWGDKLFAQDTIESINEATQIYVLAYHLLGPRPEQIPELVRPVAKTYAELAQQGLDDFSNVLVEIQNRFPYVTAKGASVSNTSGVTSLNIGRSLYFGIPKNEELLRYWDRVEDRLFKVRHCLNLEGVARTLPLFEPPIDPSLVVKATAAGLDIGNVLTDVQAPLGHYRFSYLLSKAIELCAEVKSMGNMLLSALEKKDAESLSYLKAQHETSMVQLVRQVKQQQITEAKTNLEGLHKTKAITEYRYNYYKNMEFTNAFEKAHLDLSNQATFYQVAAQVPELASSIARALPEVDLGASGWAGTPVFKLRYGGSNIGAALEAFSRFMNIMATITNAKASMSATMGGYKRRADEWKLQENLADREIKQIDKQIAAAEIRIVISETDLQNHDHQIEHTQEVEAYLRDKYTNQELYQWMVSQVSSLFFQAYQLAYQAAKKAEKAYQFERGITSSNYIQFGHWDSLKKGLLAGERLYLDLKRLEMAYQDQNAREYELTKQISLLHLDPLALIAIKTTGRCTISLPEELFDLDQPGHYMRRIKGVTLTIPCVTGPYTGVNGRLTLESSKIRTSKLPTNYAEQRDEDFLVDFSTMQSIATSTAQTDSGLFELSFRDERYLPFEGAGVISQWQLELPKETNGFDFDTISDVVIKLQYTAREGGENLRQAAIQAAQMPAMPTQGGTGVTYTLPVQDQLHRVFSVKHEFANEWRQFLYPAATTTKQECKLKIHPDRFPFRFRGRKLKIEQMQIFLVLKDGIVYPNGKAELDLVFYPAGSSISQNVSLHADPNYMNGMPQATVSIGGVEVTHDETNGANLWTWETTETNISQLDAALIKTSLSNRKQLNPDAIEDILIVCRYKVE